ncbi:MAG: hypothetical protein OEZ06_32105 [Myxococcales bacterium]|nr:hypothetical protein [Myxococcales bacterium]
MFDSPSTFRIQGDGAEVTENLKKHVAARMRILDNIRHARFSFAAGNATHEPDVDIDWRQDPQGYLEAINEPSSRISCERASSLVFYGGIGESFGTNYSTRPINGGQRIPLPTSKATEPWIPGDWGHIVNTSALDAPAQWDREAPGLEGENIFFLKVWSGSDVYWGHLNDGSSYRNVLTLNDWGRRIRTWRISLDAARPALRGSVKYPTIGLEPGSDGWERNTR